MAPNPKSKFKSDSAYFEPGSAVEVTMEEDGFRGSWFSGTIVCCLTSNRFLVEYHYPIADEQSHKPFREVVSLHQLRPLPLPESHVEFKSHHNWINKKPPQGISTWRNRGEVGGEIESKRNRKHDRISELPDRISELPDSVLLHIMTFMATKSAIRTCVLSKRWKDLCKRLTNLTFHYPCLKSFYKFVSWVLSSRDDSCSLLNLVIDSWINPQVLDMLIKYAVFHNVQQLTMNVNSIIRPTLDIFCCQSLTSLKFCVKVTLPKSLHLPALRSLHLEDVIFTADNNDCAEPFSNCHRLNTLFLKYCYARVLNISNSSLSSLTIHSLVIKDCEIALSTPNLSSCTFMGYTHHQLSSTCNLSFLEKVNFDMLPLRGLSSFLLRWLQVLANVKILTLTSGILKAILHDLSSNPTRPKPPCFVRWESLKVNRQLPVDNISDEEVAKVVEYLLQNSLMARVDIITCA